MAKFTVDTVESILQTLKDSGALNGDVDNLVSVFQDADLIKAPTAPKVDKPQSKIDLEKSFKEWLSEDETSANWLKLQTLSFPAQRKVDKVMVQGLKKYNKISLVFQSEFTNNVVIPKSDSDSNGDLDGLEQPTDEDLEAIEAAESLA